MAKIVKGELYEELDGMLCEIKRQIRQKSGYPYDPEQLKQALQAAIEGRFVDAPVAASSAVANIFHVLVNYDLRLDAAIRDRKFDFVDSDITEKNFPTTRTGQKEGVEMKLYHFNRNIGSKQAIKEMKKDGYRPAELHDGLAFVAKNPDLQKQFPIVILGSVWRDWDGGGVACLSSLADLRVLGLSCFGGGWGGHCQFLAVRES